jgi:hypothetical protein
MALTITSIPDCKAPLGPSQYAKGVQLQPGSADYPAGGYVIPNSLGVGANSSVTGFFEGEFTYGAWIMSGNAASSEYGVEFVLPSGSFGTTPAPGTSLTMIVTQPVSVGLPLSLGTLSAAATQSTYTTAGLLTVATTTPPPLGAFIVFSNGTTAAGLPFNGVMARVTAVVAGVSYSVNFGQGVALDYVATTDTLKYQVVQASAGNVVQAQALAAPITGVLATANLLTITQANSLQVGQFVYLNGPFESASKYALGAIVQVASATATGWTANWQGTIINQTSAETAVASLLVTNGNAPVMAYPYAAGPVATITNSLAVASAAAAAGLFTLTAAQAYQPGMIIVIQGLGVNTTANGSIATVIASGLTEALIKANGWTVVQNTEAETEGYASVLVTGTPTSAPQVSPGTDLSACTWFAEILTSGE